MTKLLAIEGIGPVYAEKLETAGIPSIEDLLTACKTPKDRKELAEKAYQQSLDMFTEMPAPGYVMVLEERLGELHTDISQN